MHIAHVSPRYVPAELRGGEQYIRILCEQSAKQEKTIVLTSNANDLRGNLGLSGNFYLTERTARINGVDVLRFPVIPRVSYVLKKMERGFRLLSSDWMRYAPFDYAHLLGWGPLTPSMYLHLTKSDYDFVHATIWPTTTLFLAFRACQKAKIPFAITPFYHYRLKEFTQSAAIRRILPLCTAVIAVTDGERKELLRVGARAERTFVVPLALDTTTGKGNGDRFRKKHSLEGKFVVFANPWMGKGIGDVVLALKKLSKRFVNIALVTFGEPDEEYLSLLSSQQPLGFKVVNLGWIYGQDKYDMFAGSDVLALPSIQDAFGMVYLEAWASGKPVIGAKKTAVEDIIKDGEDGFLVEFHNVQELESKLAILMEDPETPRRMGMQGKARIETEFTPDNMTRLFKQALTKSLDIGLPYT